jgi:molybdopterin converting factor small subunit
MTMRVVIHYRAQMKQVTGVACDEIELADGANVLDAIRHAAERHGEPLRRLVLDDAGGLLDSLLLFVGEEQIAAARLRAICDGDEITLLAPMAGG